jgi:Zn ribbon nucleic-acid-binding protein
MATSPHPYRWKHDRPPSLQEFMAQFPDDAACEKWLAGKRWPDGFVCPECKSRKSWKRKNRPLLYECAACGKQTSVTAGTIMHGTHLPPRTWFLAAYFMATHSNGMSALQLQAKLGIGSYKSAWLLLHKLRKATVDPERTPLAGMIEADESSIPFRTKDEPVSGGQGRSHDGKILIAGAVECAQNGTMRRVRLSQIVDYTADSLKEFIGNATAAGASIVTDGFASYCGLANRKHIPRTVGTMAAHILLPSIHDVFANLKRFGLGVYHGFRKKHIQAYFDEFTFRWNRKRSFRTAWSSLLGIGLNIPPMDYWSLTGRSSPNRRSQATA